MFELPERFLGFRGPLDGPLLLEELEERQGALAQPGDEAPERGDAPVEALDVLDPLRRLQLLDSQDLVGVGLDSPVR